MDALAKSLIARACLKNTGNVPQDVRTEDGVISPASPSEDVSVREAISRFAEKLFARPYAVSPSDLTELQQQGLDEGRILDVVFRVSVLAGIAKLDAAPLAESISGSV